MNKRAWQYSWRALGIITVLLAAHDAPYFATAMNASRAAAAQLPAVAQARAINDAPLLASIEAPYETAREKASLSAASLWFPKFSTTLYEWVKERFGGDARQTGGLAPAVMDRPYRGFGAGDMAVFAQYALGDAERNFLILLANSNELRAQGGFYGNYALVKTKAGSGELVKIDDAYNLDNAAAANGYRPAADAGWSAAFGDDRQFLRDENWKPGTAQLSSAAAKFQSEWNAAYPGNKINGIDAVIVVTPEAVQPLLAVTGPLTVDGVTYGANDFAAKLQFEVEQEFWKKGKNEKNRKEAVWRLGEALIAKMKESGALAIFKYKDAFEEAMKSKRASALIVARPSDADAVAAARSLAALGWDAPSGVPSVADVRDRFGAYDVNVKSLKTDAVMDKRISYSLSLRAVAGGWQPVVTQLHSYGHTSAVHSWRIGDYRSATWVPVADGAEAVAVTVSRGNGKPEAVAFSREGAFVRFEVSVEKNRQASYAVSYRLPVILPAGRASSLSLRYDAQPGRRLGTVERGTVPEDIRMETLAPLPVAVSLTGANSVAGSFSGIGDGELRVTLLADGSWAWNAADGR